MLHLQPLNITFPFKLNLHTLICLWSWRTRYESSSEGAPHIESPPSTPTHHLQTHLYRWDHAGRCSYNKHHTRCPRHRARRCVPPRTPLSPWGPSLRGRRWSSHRELWTPFFCCELALHRDPPSRSCRLLARRFSPHGWGNPMASPLSGLSHSKPPPDWPVEATSYAGQLSQPPRPCWP